MELGTVAVVAEKPSVARDIARVLGADQRGDGVLRGSGWVVTWAIGHLAALAEPHEIRPEWRAWRQSLLPMIPERWPLVVYEKTRAQFEVVKRVLLDPAVERVICATDAGREGELIFRYIYEAAGASKPVERLWISSLTPDAIRAGLERLRPQREVDGLADAARGRSRADWLVGMNLSRAYTLARRSASRGELLSVGRVQTPTLAILVERELAIRRFVPEDYCEVTADFAAPGAPEGALLLRGTWFRPTPAGSDAETQEKARRLPGDGEEAERIAARVKTGRAVVESVEAQTRRVPPPLLYDLTELQRHANRRFGWSAAKTLEIAQSLYETKKLISYPRTDARHLSRSVAATLPRIVRAIREPYESQLAEGTGERPLGARFVDDAKLGDHHAIIPTGASPANARMSPDEASLFDLICRRLLAAWHEDHLYASTSVVTAVESGSDSPQVDRFASRGSAVVRVGWRALEPDPAPPDVELPPGLAPGQTKLVVDARAERKRTRPPRRLTEATLLTAMETAGRDLEDRELVDAMRETGLGTPATRASIIETLLARKYVERDGKSLAATDKGIELIEIVHPDVKSPAMTGAWEARLARVEKGDESLGAFLADIERYVVDVVKRVRTERPAPPPPRAPQLALDLAPRPEPRPTPPDDLLALLQKAFGHPSFRPFQEAVCRAVTSGEDALLVMPTGAGKSLCYQLPGLARGGTTLVVSPLIALMDDQVAQLRARGLRAERIHSGRARAESQAVLRAYLDGQLDFLFIAPERLAVPGFPEKLAQRKPALVAVDEAHCISHWGHDFRPEYRMLRERLPQLRPAPVIALTATATPLVQRDIAEQLGTEKAGRYIHGFRRTNLAIELCETPPSARDSATERLLRAPERRPAIVYAPTRKKAEALARRLARHFPAAAYHAGMPARDRDEIQTAFLSGRLEAIVATIAFGMGIDKADVRTVVHTALPSSVESYYQEIGRAGRDGKQSRAVLFHGFVDLRTHEHFLARDYPEPEVLERVFRALATRFEPRVELQRELRMDPDLLEKALEKLWIHGGAQVDADENTARGHGAWREPYAAQLRHKRAQLEQIRRFSESRGCRMVHLVRHFGDEDDSGAPCGLCDICAPGDARALSLAAPDVSQAANLARIVARLRERNAQPAGKLHREAFGETLERKSFEALVGALVRAGLAVEESDSFERDGEIISFTRLRLTRAGLEAGDAQLAEVRVARAVEPELKTRRKKKSTRARGRRGVTTSAEPDGALFVALQRWRNAEAKRRRIPAFRVMSNATLAGIATERPRDERELLAVKGIGPALAAKFGEALLELVAQSRESVSRA